MERFLPRRSLTPEEKVLLLSRRLSLLFWFTQIGLLAFAWRFLPPQAPLFFSRPWGEEQLIPRLGLLLLPFTSLGVFLLNLAIANLAPREERLISQTLTIATVIFNFLCLISLGQIIRLIT